MKAYPPKWNSSLKIMEVVFPALHDELEADFLRYITRRLDEKAPYWSNLEVSNGWGAWFPSKQGRIEIIYERHKRVRYLSCNSLLLFNYLYDWLMKEIEEYEKELPDMNEFFNE
jgi:hypothetical protein